MRWFKKLFSKANNNEVPADNTEFPAEVLDYWYCGSWYMYLSELRDSGEYTGTTANPENDIVASPREGTKICFNPWRMGWLKSDKSGLVEGLVPAIRIGDEIGLYRVVRGPYGGGGCNASWDDGKYVDLKFIRCISYIKPQAEPQESAEERQ